MLSECYTCCGGISKQVLRYHFQGQHCFKVKIPVLHASDLHFENSKSEGPHCQSNFHNNTFGRSDLKKSGFCCISPTQLQYFCKQMNNFMLAQIQWTNIYPVYNRYNQYMHLKFWRVKILLVYIGHEVMIVMKKTQRSHM